MHRLRIKGWKSRLENDLLIKVYSSFQHPFRLMAGNFLLRAQEKVTKEKGTPAVMACGSLRQLSVITGTRRFGIPASTALTCAIPRMRPYPWQLPQHDKGGENTDIEISKVDTLDID